MCQNVVKSILKDEYGVTPICFVSDNASNCVLSNDLLADWANEECGITDGDVDNSTVPDQGTSEKEIQLISEEINELVDLDDLTKAVFVREFQLSTDAIGCHAHLLNLILNDSFKEFDTEFSAMLEFVKSHRRSGPTRAYIAQRNGNKRVYFPKPVRTRWKYQYVQSQFI